MCNLVTSTPRSNQWVHRYYGRIGEQVPDWFEENPPHMVHAYARPTLPIILADWTIAPASWTYMPPPQDKVKDGWMVQTFNTKGEEAYTKRTWSTPIRERRCVVPVVAYHEHQHRGKARVPYRFHMEDSGVFFLAGVWKFYADEKLYRFSILTKLPNRINKWVHNSNPRQPVTIPEEQLEIYLNGTDELSLAPFLRPNDADGIIAEEGVGLNGEPAKNPPPPPPMNEANAEPTPGEFGF